MKHANENIPELDDLIYKFTELLTGEASDEMVEKVVTWSLYSHMLKVMPPLVHHWTADHPEAKAQIREIFEQIQRLNQENKEKIRRQQNKHLNQKKD
ncbi:MAG: DUF2573 family protein [Bacillaceae bacterium]|nr:DUF2573 family protein [Bacillaceae bacterium]